jgi:2-phosphoglycerate kinase
MAKLFVINSGEGTNVPFLRGILTRSLQDAGIDFEEAYDVASEIRDALSEDAQIQTWELRKLVAERLRERLGEHAADRYVSRTAGVNRVTVLGEEGQPAAYSVDVHSKSLELCGIAAEDARNLSRLLGRHLMARRRREVSKPYLGRLTYRMLAREVDKKTAQRYLVWRDFKRSGIPLLLLVGGTAGSGKSTLATEVASRLDVFRTQSTDMLREIMRMMTPERMLPILHRSSFEAWRALPDTSGLMDIEDRIATGYRSQTELLTVACEAVVQRAVRERVSMVLEGVHIDATMAGRLRDSGGDIIVVPIMLAILKQEVLRKRIRGRGNAVAQRRAQRYLKSFDAIWQLQSYLLSEADREQISIVVNDDRENTIVEVLRIIGDTLSARLEPSLKRVFPATG